MTDCECRMNAIRVNMYFGRENAEVGKFADSKQWILLISVVFHQKIINASICEM